MEKKWCYCTLSFKYTLKGKADDLNKKIERNKKFNVFVKDTIFVF